MSGLDRLRAVATRLITNYGRTVTLTRQATSDYDPNTGSSTVSLDEITVKAVIDKYDALQIAKGGVESGDVRLLVEDIDPPPKAGDSFLVNGDELQVIAVQRISTGELNGYSEVQARRA